MKFDKQAMQLLLHNIEDVCILWFDDICEHQNKSVYFFPSFFFLAQL